MKPLREELVSSDFAIREMLKTNILLAEFSYQNNINELSVFYKDFIIRHGSEFKEWLKEIKVIEKMSTLERLVSIKIKKEKFSLVQEPKTNKINLKRGVLSLGSFTKKDIHTLIAPFGVKERDPGYYLLVLYMMQESRQNTLNFVDILKSY